MTPRTKNVSRRRGFNLVEVMFAVITLGIGLIMVAAMFPVAIQQTKLTSEEGTVAAIAWNGMNTMTALGQSPSSLPATGTSSTARTGKVVPLAVGGTTWKAIAGNLILPADNRYAWVPLYRRDGDPLNAADWDTTAQVILIGVKVRNTSTFVAADVADAATSNLYPRLVNVKIANGVSGAADLITFTGGATGAVAEGTYVVIADDKITTPSNETGRMNGRVYRVGNSTATANVWELMPGFDFNPDSGIDGVLDTAFGGTGSSTDDVAAIGNTAVVTGSSVKASGPADAYIIGRGYESGTTTYGGPAMDVSVYTGFVYAK